MSRRLVTVTPDTPIAQAAALLLTYRIGCLPVVAAAGAPATDEAPVWGPAPSWEPAPLALGIHLRLVTEGRAVEGIVTWRDIVAYYLNGGRAVAEEGTRS